MRSKMFRVRLYARVSTNDQETLALRNSAMHGYAARDGGMITLQVREAGSGAAQPDARFAVTVHRDARSLQYCVSIPGRPLWRHSTQYEDSL
jgi:hypothetical protein